MKEAMEKINQNLRKMAFETIGKQRGPMYMRCYLTFWFEVIIRERSKFQIVFPGKYSVSFLERMKDWGSYYWEKLKLAFIKEYDFGFKKERARYELLDKEGIDYTPKKPVHVKLSNSPDEALLNLHLEQNGMKITNETIDGIIMVYDVEVVAE